VRPESKMTEVMNCRRERGEGEEEEDDYFDVDDDEYNALLTVRTPCVLCEQSFELGIVQIEA
jgi:hypothetical protein